MGCGNSSHKGRSFNGSNGASVVSTQPSEDEKKIVMGRYTMSMAKQALMGEGASSICRRAIDIESGEALAIKVYKDKFNVRNSAIQKVMMTRFTRQVEVLLALLEPFNKDTALPGHWHASLDTAKPSNLFMVLRDYSKNTDGSPGADALDGVPYVVTELAQYSLKDYIRQRREQSKPISKDSVKTITRAVLLVVAGLHAKSLVHIDLKPENLMVFSGRVKLIDVDGCVKANTEVSINDSSISFSPCYCAPEWALGLVDGRVQTVTIRTGLDVWSVGMTVSELVMLRPVLKPVYLNFLRNSRSHKETGILFLEWLSHIDKVPLPKPGFDSDMLNLLRDCLLVSNWEARISCAQALNHPFVCQGIPALLGGDNEVVLTEPDDVSHEKRARSVDDSTGTPLFHGMLWKLNAQGNPSDPAHWLQREMWLSAQGNLCYFSAKENIRLVLVDAAKLGEASIKSYAGGHRSPAFEIKWTSDEQDQIIILAADSTKQCKEWMSVLDGAARLDMPTMHLGGTIADLRKFVIRIQNRRRKVTQEFKEEFSPVYSEKLWKLMADGDPQNREHWFERGMWIAKNGSLVYYSKKEERDLVYYTAADLMRATYVELPESSSAFPWSFQVYLPKIDDVEFAPGNFAANSQELRDRWMIELKGATQRISQS